MTGGSIGIVEGRLVLEDRIAAGRLILEDGRIAAIEVDDDSTSEAPYMAHGFVDVHVLVAGKTSVQAGHDLVEALEAKIVAQLPHVEVLIHLEPIEDPKSWDDPEKPLAGS